MLLNTQLYNSLISATVLDAIPFSCENSEFSLSSMPSKVEIASFVLLSVVVSFIFFYPGVCSLESASLDPYLKLKKVPFVNKT